MLRSYFVIFCFFPLLFGCSFERETKLHFQVKYQNDVWQCDDAFLSQVMFYLSEFSTDKQLNIKPSRYSHEKVALLGADCTSNLSWQLVLAGVVVDGSALSFTLGVPFELNHTNPLTAPSPLNVSEMFWSWQLGHKFLRIDSLQDFAFHLGSTGCKSQSRLRAPNDECAQPNRFRFTIDEFDSAKPLIFDLNRLLNDAELSRSCMSDTSAKLCQQLFANLRHAVFYQE